MALQLSNIQYDKLMNIYRDNRLKALSSQKTNRSLAYERIPELSSLDFELTDATRNLRGSSLTSKIDEIRKKKVDLLTKNGFTVDFLDIHYNCNDCKDTGFIDGERCHCFKDMIIRMFYSKPRWQAVFESENFDSFDISLYDGPAEVPGHPETEPKVSAMDALNKAHDFIDSILKGDISSGNNLVITGFPGTGKTFLCNCIAKELIENGHFVVYLNSQSLFELFERAAFSGSRSRDEYSPEVREMHYSNIFDCDLLIIDDLGTEFGNNFTVPKLFDLINKRLMTAKPTLISTNLDMEGLKDLYSERLTSRIVGNYKFIHLYGEDIRLKKRRLMSKGA